MRKPRANARARSQPCFKRDQSRLLDSLFLVDAPHLAATGPDDAGAPQRDAPHGGCVKSGARADQGGASESGVDGKKHARSRRGFAREELMNLEPMNP